MIWGDQVYAMGKAEVLNLKLEQLQSSDKNVVCWWIQMLYITILSIQFDDCSSVAKGEQAPPQKHGLFKGKKKQTKHTTLFLKWSKTENWVR